MGSTSSTLAEPPTASTHPPPWAPTKTSPTLTRLPLDQGRRLGPTPDPPLPVRPRPRPRADLRAGLLPDLAPTCRASAADLHRRTPTGTRQPRRPSRLICQRGAQSRLPPRHRWRVLAQLPWPARTHGHPDAKHHHTRPGDFRQDHPAYPNATADLRTTRRTDSTHADVDRAKPASPTKLLLSKLTHAQDRETSG